MSKRGARTNNQNNKYVKKVDCLNFQIDLEHRLTKLEALNVVGLLLLGGIVLGIIQLLYKG